MMKGKIYTITTKMTYDLMCPRLFRADKFIEQCIDTDITRPIFATNPDEAREKYKNRYKWETVEPLLWENKADNIKREVVMIASHNKYTFDQLKANMNSQDFLEYCRQELLDVNEVIN